MKIVQKLYNFLFKNNSAVDYLSGVGLCFNCFLLVFLLVFPSSLQAQPWWWTQFTSGEDTFDHSSNFEKWVALYPYSAQPDEDVWMASYTWGTGNNGPINGFYGDNELGGINELFLRRKDVSGAAPVRVLGDGDHTDIFSTVSSGLPVELSPPDSSLSFEGSSHHKAIMLGERSLMIGSANMTAGAFTSQPNNMTVFQDLPELNRAFRREFEEQFSGSHFDNSASSRNHFTAPTGQRVSAYFAPDDNFNITMPDGSSGLKISDVLEKRTAEADESVFYLMNNMYLPYLANSLQAAASDKLVEGVVDNGDASFVSELKNSHTSRDADSYFSREMHHKVMIIDQEIVVFGSANHTRKAMYRTMGNRNEENLVEVHDFRMARRYMQEYRRVMGLLAEESEGQPDSFETTPPDPPTDFVATDEVGRSNSLVLNWSAPQAPGDFSRYYVFVAPRELNSAQQLGNGKDNDGDGQIDEDPIGDADGFASGTSLSELRASDDDADGRVDEDPWMYPEKQVKASGPGEVTSTTLTTFNVGEQLPDDRDLWLALVAVDKHGNESDPVFYGPVQSHAGAAAIQPSVNELKFAPDASTVAGDNSVVKLTVSNNSSAAEKITGLTIKLGAGDSTFRTRSFESEPQDFEFAVASNSITLAAKEGKGIAPGTSEAFDLYLKNPVESGTSGEITVDFEDKSGAVVTDVSAGGLEILPPPVQEGTKNAIRNLSATAGEKSISLLDGTKKLGSPAYEINVELEDEVETGVELYWDIENTPDGPGGNSSDKKVNFSGSDRVYTATVEDTDAIAHGDSFNFLLFVDGEEFNYSGSPYAFIVDRKVTSPALTEVKKTGSKSVQLGINPISDPDFASYRIYFQEGNSVDKNVSYREKTKRDVSTVTVDNLSPAATYTFGAAAVDKQGNVSELSGFLRATTGQSSDLQRVMVYNQDKSRTATSLDGTEKFQVEPLTVQMEFNTLTHSPVKVYYDVGDNPDGPGGFNRSERVVTANGSDTLWEAGLPAADSEIAPGKTLKFVVVAGDQVLDNGGQPFKLSYLEPPPQINNLTVTDTGGGSIELSWSARTKYPNFGEYRLYYTSSGDTPDYGSQSWTPVNHPPLTLKQTEKTVVDGLAPGESYRFRIAVVDEFGQPGELSNTAEGTPGPEGAVLLTELSPQSTPNWVEITARVPGVNLRDYYLSDLDGNTEPLATESTSISAVQRVVLWLESGVSETDFTGDKDGDGVVDIYRPGAASVVFADTVDQLVLKSQAGDTVDAVVYRSDPSAAYGAAGEQGDVDNLADGDHWNTGDSVGALNTYVSASLSRDAYLIRTRHYGQLQDSNSRAEWAVVGQSTPGAPNEKLRIFEPELRDVPTSDYHYSSAVAAVFDGSEKIKNTDTYILTARFNRPPVADSGFYIWYDTDAEPGGFSNPGGDSVRVEGNYDSSRKKFQGRFSLAGLTNEDRVEFLVSSLPDPAAPAGLDEAVFSNKDQFYKFEIDDRGIKSPDSLAFVEAYQEGLMLSWKPTETRPDFSTYRIYYDTGPVTLQSEYFDASDLPSLADYRTSQAIIPLPVAADTWHVRMAAVDRVGNGNEMVNNTAGVDELADTLAVRRLQPINLEDLIFTPARKTRNDSYYLPAKSISVRAIFNRTTEAPLLAWDKNDSDLPDTGMAGDTGRVMKKIMNREYEATIPPGKHGDDIQFIFRTDGGKLTNNGAGYNYRVDNQATPAVNGFAADTIQYTSYQNKTTDIQVEWKPVDNSVNDFSAYRVVYAKGNSVSKQSATVGPGKVSLLSDRRTSSIVVPGLDRATTYTLAAYWKDEVGNSSPLSDTFTIQTVNAQPTEDPADDGQFVAHALDGSEYLRKNNIRVTFEFQDGAVYPEDVSLIYNIGAAPRDTGSQTLTMQPVSERVFKTTIPESPRMTEGVSVNYLIKEGPWYVWNDGKYFSFKIDEFPPPRINNFQVEEEGDWLKLSWAPVNSGEDFREYRVRYRKPGESSWRVIDSSDYSLLGDYRTSSVYLDELAPDANYYLNFTAVDKMGRVNYRAGDRLLLRSPGTQTPRFEFGTEPAFTLESGETQAIGVKLIDIFDSPWYNREIDFVILKSGLNFEANNDTQISVKTGPAGRAKAVIKATGSYSGYVPVKARFEDQFFTETFEYSIRLLSPSEAAKKPRMVPFEK